jgi:hypothetical protein
MLTFLQDVRFAFRRFASHPGFTLLLMTAAGAAIQGFRHMMRIPLGYDPHHVMSVGIPIHDNTYTTISERTNYYEQLRGAIGALPDIVATGISTNATPPNNGWNQPFELLGKPSPEEQQARLNFVDPGYFTTLHMPLRQGRGWDRTELVHGAPLVLVNESFAKRFRMALGAQKKDVLWNVLASAGGSVGSGLLLGLAISIGLNRLISRWVENGAHDPWLTLGVSCVLLAVAGLACLLPSWRASSVDPMTALRCE